MKLQALKALLAIALVGIASITPASAHHSIAAFDGKQTLQITGIVKEFQWMNPHVIIVVEGMATGDASTSRWAVEMQAPNAMMDQGWARDTLAIGDKITIIASPLRHPDPASAGNVRVLYAGVVLPSGKTLGHTGEP